MAERFVDLVNGNDANDGTTFALRKKTIASAFTGLSTTQKHTIRVMESDAPVDTGVDATWTFDSDLLTLAAPVTADIDTCDAIWTGVTNVTPSVSTTVFRQGTGSANLVVASAFTTGKIAYKAVTLDLSSYEQVSFWIRTSAAQVANRLELRLCSDAIGDVAVHTIPVDVALTASIWQPIVKNFAAALSSGINSVALYTVADPGPVTINLDNIFASKAASSADSLTLHSLIGKPSASGAGPEPWMAIESISGTAVYFGAGASDLARKNQYAAKYFGTTETVRLWRLECIPTAALSVAITSSFYKGSGDILDHTSLVFGYSRIDMSAVTGFTALRPFDVNLQLITNTSFTDGGAYFNAILAGCRAVSAVSCTGSNGNDHLVQNTAIIACRAARTIQAKAGAYTDDYTYVVGARFLVRGSGSSTGGYNAYCKQQFDFFWGISRSDPSSATTAGSCLVWDDGAKSSLGYAMKITGKTVGKSKVYNVYCAIRQFSFTNAAGSIMDMEFRNIDFVDAVYMSLAYAAFITKFINCDRNTANHYLNSSSVFGNEYRWSDYTVDPPEFYVIPGQRATISSANYRNDTSVRYGASDYSWRYELFTSDGSRRLPYRMPLCRVLCSAGAPRTVRARARLESLGSGNEICRIAVDAFELPGIDADVFAERSILNPTDWELLEITFTPTVDGVVQVYFEVVRGDSSPNGVCWVDDVQVI